MNGRMIAVKALRGLGTVLILLTLVFVVLRLSGDPLDAMLGPEADPAMIDYYRHLYGLDQPLWSQYVHFFIGIAHGDLGQSFLDGRDALQIVLERVPFTLQLGGAALAFAIVLGIPLGVVAALKRNSAFDRFTMGFAVLGFSLPNFFLGILLILLFAMTLRWLPSSGSGSWQHMVMPVFTLGTAAAGQLAQFARSSMLEVLNQPYIRAARAKGVPWWRVITWHAIPNAAIPVITILGFRLGDLIAGSVVTETVFAWPGVGRLLITSVSARDLAVVQTIIILVGATMVAANFMVDLLYGWIDPRLRAPAAERKA